jgi:hypothetical protein
MRTETFNLQILENYQINNVEELNASNSFLYSSKFHLFRKIHQQKSNKMKIIIYN